MLPYLHTLVSHEWSVWQGVYHPCHAVAVTVMGIRVVGSELNCHFVI